MVKQKLGYINSEKIYCLKLTKDIQLFVNSGKRFI